MHHLEVEVAHQILVVHVEGPQALGAGEHDLLGPGGLDQVNVLLHELLKTRLVPRPVEIVPAAYLVVADDRDNASLVHNLYCSPRYASKSQNLSFFEH